ncbi:MAG: AtpZ/AtpI family protein [Magnetococcales bacterium]|nr:AtpZ/AtpI family protein [Magnetococcales bacterium]
MAIDEPPQIGMHSGMRLATELASAVLIGGAMGYGLDRWLGSQPWMTILFFFFGMAAGFLNLYRAAYPDRDTRSIVTEHKDQKSGRTPP